MAGGQSRGDRYINTFPDADEASWINSRDLDAIAQKLLNSKRSYENSPRSKA